MILTKKQTQALDTLENQSNGVTEVIYGGSAGSGKSIVGTYWILKSCLKYEGTRWLLGRSILKTLKQTTLQSLFEVCKMQGLIPQVHYTYKEQAGEVHFFNGSIIILADLDYYPSDPNFDRLGGLEITGAFIDEVAQVRKQAWDIVKSRIRYRLTEYGLVPKLFGSLNPSTNWCYTYFYKPHQNDTLEPFKAFIQALPTDNPHLADSYLETLRNLPRRERDRLYYGRWESGDDNQLINNDAIGNIFTNTFIKPTNHKYIIVDIARKGKDKTVIMRWNGMVVEETVEYKINTITEIADAVKQMAHKHQIPMSNVLVDESGVGGGLVDILRCKGFIGGSKALNGENYFNLRTQCLYYLAKYINENSIFINIESESIRSAITEELEQIKSDINDLDSKLKVISKDEVKSNIGRSPDYSDTLSMRMYFQLNKNTGIYSFV